MKKPHFHHGLAITIGLMPVFLLLLILVGCENQRPTLVLGGGTTDGTAQNFAVALRNLINQGMSEIQVTVKHSAGSVDNLFQVDQAKMTMALVNAEDAYLGDIGQLSKDQPPTKNVLAVVRLFGSAAQLVVSRNSPFQSPHDLKNIRVAIGNPGSSSAHSAERYFRSLDMWEKIVPIYVSDVRGLRELVEGSVSAVWVLSDVPNETVEETNRIKPIRFLDLWEAAAPGGFFQKYPYYSLSSIPAGTYKGQELEIYTIESPILLVANKALDEKIVYRLLKLLFSDAGLEKMRSMHPAATDGK
jgi:hypothetical protein